MNDSEKFVYENLEKKSSAIAAFIIFQSLALAYQFSKTEFILKIQEINLTWYLLIAHVFLLIFSVVFIILINKKMNQKIGNLRKEVFSNGSNIVKICLILLFGAIPIYVLVKSVTVP